MRCGSICYDRYDVELQFGSCSVVKPFDSRLPSSKGAVSDGDYESEDDIYDYHEVNLTSLFPSEDRRGGHAK